VYNEASTIRLWLDAISRQTVCPTEFVIVDGGSVDETVDMIKAFKWPTTFIRPKVIVKPCNIATGRNIAISSSTSPIVACTDAGSIPDQKWLELIIEPLMKIPEVDVVGGACPSGGDNVFQNRLKKFYSMDQSNNKEGADCSPSSRNAAFRRKAWLNVGGYPEWLTLTAEDSLYNDNLHATGCKFYYEPKAIVTWILRPTLTSYLRMMYRYGFGSAEANQGTPLYLKWMFSVVFPPAMLLSKHSLRDLPFRYLRNLSAVSGWVLGILKGHKKPTGWKNYNNILLSPESLKFIGKQ
jgi:glycosyltransferase involved in cell wall biosynthesis